MNVTISTLLLLLIGVAYVASQQCHMDELQACLLAAPIHYQNHGFPDDDEKVTGWCDTLKDMRQCMRTYSDKCLSPMQKELSSLLGDGASDIEVQLCTSGTEIRNNYLKHSKCVVESAESDAFKTIIKDLQVAIETTYDTKFKDRLPTFCCGADRFHADAEAIVRSNCGEDAVKMLQMLFDMILTELPKTICQSFKPDSATCKKLLPPSGTLPKGRKSESELAKLVATIVGN